MKFYGWYATYWLLKYFQILSCQVLPIPQVNCETVDSTNHPSGQLNRFRSRLAVTSYLLEVDGITIYLPPLKFPPLPSSSRVCLDV